MLQLKLAIILILFTSVICDLDCNNADKSKIFSPRIIDFKSSKLHIEYYFGNDGNIDKNEKVVEDFDPITKTGYIGKLPNNVRYSYFPKSLESFIIQNFNCESVTYNKSRLIEWAKTFLPESLVSSNENYFGEHIGILSVLRIIQENKGKFIYKYDNSTKKNVYRLCDSQNDIVIDVNMTVDYKRVIIYKYNGNESYKSTTIEIHKLDRNSSLLDRFSIVPPGFGCSRTDSSQKLKPLSFQGERFLMNITATKYDTSDYLDPFAEKEDFTLVFDRSMNVLAFTSFDKETGDRMRHIVNKETFQAYEINMNKDKCVMNQTFEDPLRFLKWPLGKREKINLLNIILFDMFNDKYTYLGEYLERLNPSYVRKTLVYEKVINDLDIDGNNNTFVITDFRAPNSELEVGSLESVGPPRRIHVQVFSDSGRSSLLANFNFEINLFTEKFLQRHSLNITSCATHSKTFSMILTYSYSHLYLTSKMREDIIKTFCELIPNFSPLRVSKASIENLNPFDYRYRGKLNFSITILERPDLKYSFVEFTNAKFTKAAIISEPKVSIEQCKSLCYEKTDCQGISHSKLNGCYFLKINDGNELETTDSEWISYKRNDMKSSSKNSDIAKFLQERIKYLRLAPPAIRPYSLYASDLKIEDDVVIEKPDEEDKIDTNNEINDDFPDIFAIGENETTIITKVEIVNRDEHSNRYFEEYHDFKAERGYLKLLTVDTGVDSKSISDYIFFYDTSEYFKINQTKCETKYLDTNITILSDENIFPKRFLEQIKNYSLEMIGPTSIISFGHLARENLRRSNRTISEVYLTNVWEIDVGNTFKVVYYFWAPNDAEYEIPYSVEIFEDDRAVHIQNYATFEFNNEPNKLTLVPIGYGCKRLKNDKEKPADLFETDFRVTLEMSQIMLNQMHRPVGEVQTIKFSRFSKFNLNAFEIKMLDESDLNKKPKPFKYVYDGSNKLLYSTDLFTGECTLTTMKEGSLFEWPANSDINILGGNVWSYDDDVEYLGETIERGILVDVYEKVNESFVIDAKTKNKLPAIITYYFVKKNTFDDDILGNVADFPIRTAIRLFNDTNRDTIQQFLTVNAHYFKLLEDISETARLFDISNCFLQPNRHKWFRVAFPIDWEIYQLTTEKNAIEQAFRTAIDYIPPTRLPNVIVDITLNTVFITARLLERPSFEIAFTKIAGKQYKKQLEQSFLTESLDVCGQTCHDSESCGSFSYCKSFECDLSLKDYTKEPTLDANSCDIYIRLKDDLKKPLMIEDLSSNYLLAEIQMLCETNNFTISIPQEPDNDNETKIIEVKLKASQFKRDVEPGLSNDLIKYDSILSGSNDNDDINSMRVFQSYYINNKNSKLNLDKDSLTELHRKVASVSSYDCARICDNTVLCESFSFCNNENGKQQECIISSLHGTQITSNKTQPNENCNILSKRFTANFISFGSTKIISTSSVKVEASNIDECAKKCLQYENFECESFDYCVVDKKIACDLYKTHVITSRQTDKNSSIIKDNHCSHYAKKYSADYTFYPNMKFPMNNLVVSVALSVENCARECNEIGSNCAAFEYCNEINPKSRVVRNTCRLSTGNVYESSLVKNENCIVYTRDNRLLQHVPPVKGYSTGLGVFLALLMFAIGIASVVGGIWYYFNRQTV